MVDFLIAALIILTVNPFTYVVSLILVLLNAEKWYEAIIAFIPTLNFIYLAIITIREFR